MSARRRYVMGALCPHCNVVLTPETAWVSPLGAVVCRSKRSEDKGRWDARRAGDEPDVDDDERPEISIAPPEWERAEVRAVPCEEDAGLFAPAVILVLPGRHATAVEARGAADAFLSQLRSVPA